MRSLNLYDAINISGMAVGVGTRALAGDCFKSQDGNGGGSASNANCGDGGYRW